MAYSRAFLALLSCRLALGELGCIAGRAAPCTRCLSKDLQRHRLAPCGATAGDAQSCSLQTVLLLLAKDLKEAYGFPVLVVCPKAMFTTCYANVPEEIEEEFLSKYGDFVRNLYDNTVTVNRIFTGMRNRRSLLM